MNRYTFTTDCRPVRPLVGQIWKTDTGGEFIVVKNNCNKLIHFEPFIMQNRGMIVYQSLERFLKDFSL